MLNKNFIKFNISKYVAFVLIIKKFDENLKVCVNYKIFNALTIKHRNALSFIKEILIKFCSTKIYNKFDIIATFNEMRIKKKNEKKKTFLIRYDLFKYVIMFFELCNVSKIFQIFINAILRKYFNDFCSKYFDDVFVYNNNKKNHIKYVFAIFIKLKEIEFYLNIDKCEFYVMLIKYLKLIITIEKIKMNFKKIDIIIN